MSGQQKKVSLFKQKIGLAKAQIKSQYNGFPIPPRIIDESIKPEQSVSSTQKEQQLPKGFLQGLAKQKIMAEQECQKIESENWKTVQSMTEAQRQEAIASLRCQLPFNFLRRLDRNQEAKIPQKVSQRNQNSPKQQQESVKQKQAQKQENINREPDEQTWQTFLKLNISKQGLQYTDNDHDNLISMSKMTQMIGSQNNQSQVIGGTVLDKWVRALVGLMTTKTRQLIVVNGVPLHSALIASQLNYAITLCFKQATRTTYRSVFIQLCASLCSTLKNIAILLDKQAKSQMSQRLNSLIARIKSLDIPKSDTVSIKDSLLSVSEYLSAQQEELNWSDLLCSIEAITELSLLQTSYKNGYWMKAFKAVQICGDLDELLDVLVFEYEFVNKLIIKRNKQPFIDIAVQRQLWTPSIEALLAKFSTACWNIQPNYLFQSIFLARFVGGSTWELISQMSQTPGEKGLLISGMLLFNTLQDLKAASISEQQIQALNHVFDWLSNFLNQQNQKKVNPNYIFSTFLELYLQEQEYYSQLKQPILQSLLKKLANHPLIHCEEVVSVQQVRTLTKNYNFSSYGNFGFGFMLLWIAKNCQSEKESIILRQCILPCWRQFASMNVNLQKFPTWESKNTSRELKEEIIEKILGEEKEDMKNNYLIQYLC